MCDITDEEIIKTDDGLYVIRVIQLTLRLH